MIVHYQQKSEQDSTQKKAAPKPQVSQSQGNSPDAAMGAITLIEVQGNVIVATPEESAKGDTGDYHVASKIIHLFGNNVTLTRDKNILRGTALEYNLETGRSVLTSGENTTTSQHGGRVRGVFVPNQQPSRQPSANPQTPRQQP